MNETNLPFPRQVYVETTNVCNQHCPGCPRDLLKSEAGGNYASPIHIGRNDYAMLVAQVGERASAAQPIRLKLFFMDEPLAHKDAVWHVQEAKRHAGLVVNITTNGTLLRPEKARPLLEAGIDEVAVSLDAVAPDYYERVRPGGGNTSLGRVIDNIYGLVKLRKELAAPTSIILTMVAHPGEDWQRQYDAMETMWGHLVDVIAYRPFSVYRGERQPIQPTFCCSEPFERMFLRANGTASLCTEDVRPDVVLGDWRKQRLEEIWQNEGYRNLRKRHRDGRYDSIDLCSRCHVPFQTGG
jgi:radical SAM protein with 4Fe4S-binding SPASM domain